MGRLVLDETKPNATEESESAPEKSEKLVCPKKGQYIF